MAGYVAPTMDEVMVLWNQGAGGKQEIRRSLQKEALRKCLQNRLTPNELQHALLVMLELI